ncbi:2-aminoethylphosphonate--pyruvate transaminase [Peribacillus asahii]|uniref:2-aminoethylphosphonate--pyruvate transaminase n=1 Tax=Peribacillus asahii TaxID=228899 RepID=UPI0038192C68
MMKNPYLLLTPGPLSTTDSVREAMMRDWCTWDDEYNELVQKVRHRLVTLATKNPKQYTAILMQGSGTFSVESTIGTVLPKSDGKLLIATNGVYGNRIAQICNYLGIETLIAEANEQEPIALDTMEQLLQSQQDITHVMMVHCETTTGILNPIKEACQLAKQYNKITIVDAMSSFGGIPLDVSELQIDFLISSSNKCIQGVPGFGFVIAKQDELAKCKGHARSLSLDLYDQHETMEKHNGKWRFTSPTHVVRAFYQALVELEAEGGIQARYERYQQNQKLLVQGMKKLGFQALIKEEYQSPIITSFLYPEEAFSFAAFYQLLKDQGFVIYPGKVSRVATFRIGNIGDVHIHDIERLLTAINNTQAKGAVVR